MGVGTESFLPLQELNRHLTSQKTEGERLLAAREADTAQLQQELVAAQQAQCSMPSMHAMHGGTSGLQHGDWQMSISEAADDRREGQPSDAALRALLEDKRKLQVCLMYSTWLKWLLWLKGVVQLRHRLDDGDAWT